MLIQSEDADTDYELKEGSYWITIGTLSVYIIKNRDHARVDIYPLNEEMEPPLHSIVAVYPQQ